MTYNQKRHIQLLKRSQDLKNQGKHLFLENPEEDLELSKYDGAVAQHIFWEDRFEVASLIQAFLNKEMDGEEFHDSVFGLRRKQIAKCDKFLSELALEKEELKDFFPNKESYKLKGFLSFLYFECEHFDDDYENDEFYTSIKNGFLKFQKALNEE
jgi:hypothetical protein